MDKHDTVLLACSSNDERTLLGSILRDSYNLLEATNSYQLNVLLTGAKAYKTLTERAETSHAYRVAVRYLTTRFHQAPRVQVEDFCGLQALTIPEEIDGKNYLTRIYCHEGQVRELFSGEQTPVSPDDGEPVLEAQGLTFSIREGILWVEITHYDGKVQQLLLNLPVWKTNY